MKMKYINTVVSKYDDEYTIKNLLGMKVHKVLRLATTHPMNEESDYLDIGSEVCDIVDLLHMIKEKNGNSDIVYTNNIKGEL